MPGRHRKTSPLRTWWATAAAATTLGLAAALPAVAVLSRDGSTDAQDTVSTVEATQSAATAYRAVTRTVSRSGPRAVEPEVLAAHQAASAQLVLDRRRDARPAKKRPQQQPAPKPRKRVLAAAATPKAAAAARSHVPDGVSGRPCPDGSGVEAGLTANAVKVYRAVCEAFPSVSRWGGRSGSGNHGAGKALDIMVTGSTGDSIAAYVRANAGRLGVSEVIWARRIWTVQRAGDGWRSMEDRGSATANHFDHVHVTVY